MFAAVLKGSFAGILLGGSLGYVSHVVSSSVDPNRYDFGRNVKYLNVHERDVLSQTVPELANIIELLADVKQLRLISIAQSRSAFETIVANTESMLMLYGHLHGGNESNLGAVTFRMNRCYSEIQKQVALIRTLYIKHSPATDRSLIACDDICNDFLTACDNMLRNTLHVDRSWFYKSMSMTRSP